MTWFKKSVQRSKFDKWEIVYFCILHFFQFLQLKHVWDRFDLIVHSLVGGRFVCSVFCLFVFGSKNFRSFSLVPWVLNSPGSRTSLPFTLLHSTYKQWWERSLNGYRYDTRRFPDPRLVFLHWFSDFWFVSKIIGVSRLLGVLLLCRCLPQLPDDSSLGPFIRSESYLRGPPYTGSDSRFYFA